MKKRKKSKQNNFVIIASVLFKSLNRNFSLKKQKMNRSDQINYRKLYSQSQQQQNEDAIKEKKKILLFKSDEHIRDGRMFYRKRQFTKAIDEFKTALKLRDSFIGRYDAFTASVYFFIGNCYFQLKEYDDALVAYRIRLRIRRRLSVDATTPRLDQRMITSLEKKGFDSEQIKKYDIDLTKSVEQENMGDKFRDDGLYKMAIFKYKRAVSIENDWPGQQHLTIAFLWRKIAFLVDRMDDMAKEQSMRTSKRKSEATILPSSSTLSDDSDDEILEEQPDGSDDGEEKRLSESCVFEAIQNLCDRHDQPVDWQEVIKCVDVKVDLKNAKKEMKVKQKLEKLQIKLERKSISGFDKNRMSLLKTDLGTKIKTSIIQDDKPEEGGSNNSFVGGMTMV